jgi:hypothetical protein
MGAAKGACRQRPVAEVLVDVLGNLQDIFGSEIRLAQARAREDLKCFRSAGALMMVGVLGGLLSALLLLFAVVAALSLLMSVWLAALLVGLFMGVMCAVLVRSGANLMRRRAAQVAAIRKERRPWAGRLKE